MILVLKPLGHVDSAVLSHLEKNLRNLGEVRIAPEAPLPADAYEDGRRQYRAARLFEACQTDPGDRVLGVTEVDVCEEDLSSVFGYAQIGGRVAIISTARLRGARRTAGRRLLAATSRRRRQTFLDRCVKEAMHELGHTLGLPHDDGNPACVMYYSERLGDTDRKGRDFCGACSPRAELTLRHLGT